jgi:hypothetical protein
MRCDNAAQCLCIHLICTEWRPRYANKQTNKHGPLCPSSSSYTRISYTRDTCSHIPTHQKSHRPSFHPVLHLSSHLAQSNLSLPNFSLTALCASHIHVPNSFLLLTRGVFLLIQSWKSSAHTQHGYSLPKVERKDLVSDWSCGDGLTG